jgi:hypothetical protein
MSNRYDLVQPREGGDKTYFTKIGVAFPMKNGGFSIVFEALPVAGINRDGKIETRALLMEPRDASGVVGGGRRDRGDDDVPF